MLNLDSLLNQIPNNLRTPLLEEFNDIHQNFLEQRWRPAELSAGRFCEIIYSIIKGYSESNFPTTPSKPRDFVGACRQLENKTNLSRSFRILIPRLLPPLYEVRNNRNVGHVSGEVDPSFMDSSFVINNINWIMAELIRVFHNTNTDEAQSLVNKITDLKIPLIWVSDDVKRLLDPTLSIKDSCLFLLQSESRAITLEELKEWLDYDGDKYLKKVLRELHKSRKIEFDESNNSIQILPPGQEVISKLISEKYT